MRASDGTFLLFSTAVVLVMVIVAGIFGYRRGYRWSLAALLTMPPGALLGIYASDHDEQWLAVSALALLALAPVTRLIVDGRARRSS